MIQQSHSWANIQRKLLFKNIHATNIHSRTAYSEVILMFTDQKIDKEDVVYRYTQWNITQPLKRMKYYHLQLHGWTQIIIQSEVY